MSDGDNVLVVSRMDTDTVGAELYLWAPDGCVDWFPFVFTGEFDSAVIEEQIRAHQAMTTAASPRSSTVTNER